MFRDRTNLYLSYRRTIPREDQAANARFTNIAEEEEGLMYSRKAMGPDHTARKNKHPQDIEMKPLAPSIFEISTSLDQNLGQIKLKTTELSMMYKKLLIARDNDKETLERTIEDLNYTITKVFEACYVLIKKFEFLEKNHRRLNLDYTGDELMIIANYKKTYALKIQDSSLVFRNLQNNYIKFLKDDDDDDETDLLMSSPRPSLSMQAQLLAEEDSRDIEDYSKSALQQAQQQLQNAPGSAMMASREREISKLAMGILEISTIFKEMEGLVVDQGSMLDRVDYNLSRAAEDLKSSDKELIKAQGYQKRTTKCKIIFLLCLVVFALFIVIVVRPSRKTTVVHETSPNPDADADASALKVDPIPPADDITPDLRPVPEKHPLGSDIKLF